MDRLEFLKRLGVLPSLFPDQLITIHGLRQTQPLLLLLSGVTFAFCPFPSLKRVAMSRLFFLPIGVVKFRMLFLLHIDDHIIYSLFPPIVAIRAFSFFQSSTVNIFVVCFTAFNRNLFEFKISIKSGIISSAVSAVTYISPSPVSSHNGFTWNREHNSFFVILEILYLPVSS